MKKFLCLTAIIFSLFSVAAKDKKVEEPQDPSTWKTIEELTADQYKFGLYNNFGVAWGRITRIEKKTEVSNFIWNDKLVGVFYEMQSHDLKKLSDHWSCNFMGRIAVYYPYAFTFRDVPQFSKQVIVYAVDLFTAPVISLNLGTIARVDFEPGIHAMYQISDKWNYWNLGAAVKVDVELPISSRWTGIVGGMFSWDNGNLGSNRGIRDFDYVWEYQAQLGFRYSKKYLNNPSYIKYKPKPIKEKKPKQKKEKKSKAKKEAAPEAEQPVQD